MTFLCWLAIGLVSGAGPEERAVAYLAREVPRWRPENRCASCHHDADGARALILAQAGGLAVPKSALENARDWLSNPERWDRNGGDGPFSDKRLARVAFSRALIEADQAGLVADRGLARRAGALLVREQAANGAFVIEPDGQIGTPATYGTPLATALGLDVLCAAHGPPEAIERAQAYLRELNPNRVPDAAAVLWGLAADDAPASSAARRRALDVLERAQGRDGGWGPYRNAPTEPFDTAFAMLALVRAKQVGRLEAGRRFLVAAQQPDGSWIETTRPPGGESYAQRVSTTAWALMALLATRPPPDLPPVSPPARRSSCSPGP